MCVHSLSSIKTLSSVCVCQCCVCVCVCVCKWCVCVCLYMRVVLSCDIPCGLPHRLPNRECMCLNISVCNGRVCVIYSKGSDSHQTPCLNPLISGDKRRCFPQDKNTGRTKRGDVCVSVLQHVFFMLNTS